MKVEISKDQKEALGKKIDLCVEYLKLNVQPHMVNSDKINIGMGELIELCITNKEAYVIYIKSINLGLLELPFKRILYLDKRDRKRAKKYICDVYPELAVEFLRNWGKARDKLIDEAMEKSKKVQDLDSFVSNFKL